MNLDRAIFAFAGVMIIISVLLTWYVSHYFLWFTVFIGANLLQSAFSGWCPAATVLGKLGFQVGCAFDKK